jgi:hypothetical protein
MPWDRPPNEQVWLAKFGVPDEWIPFCEIDDWTRDWVGARSVLTPASGARITFRIGGDAPPRTLDELSAAVDKGFNLRLELQPGFDLARIAHQLAHAERVTIPSSAHVRGWASLTHGAPRTLWINVPGEPLVAMQRMERLIARGSKSAHGVAGPQLSSAHLDLERTTWPRDLVVGPQVSDLVIHRARGLTGAPPLQRADRLRTLRVRGQKVFDAASLDGAINLEWLDLSRVDTVLGIDRLQMLPALARLDLSRVREMPGYRDLERLEVPVVTLEASRALTTDQARSLSRGRPGWGLDPDAPATE